MKEVTCRDERRVTQENIESLYCTPETNAVLHANHTGIKIEKIIKPHTKKDAHYYM